MGEAYAAEAPVEEAVVEDVVFVAVVGSPVPLPLPTGVW